MKDEQVERLLREARNRITVNEELKASLRRSLIKKRRPMWKKPWLYAGTAAALLFAILFSHQQMKHVTAEELNVTNAISFFDIGRGDITAVTHDHGQLYVSVSGEGIFLYKESGLQKLSGLEASTLHFDKDGEALLFSVDGDLVRLNVKTKKETILVKGSANRQYDQPVWKNKNELYAVKKEGSQEEIVHLSLKTKKETVVADGSHPVLMEQNGQIVYEQDGTIVMQDVETRREQSVDRGTSPSVSEDGRYLSYIKEENGIGDVWIVDADLKTKKKVTSNLSTEVGNKETSVYQYSSTVWDSGKRQLYVMKTRTLDEENKQVQVMKIELTQEALTAEQTVERYLQALIVRDDDYAKSLMENPPEFLTYSNPHQTGYRVLQTEQRGDAAVIQAELYREDTARPYYSVTTYEFELKKGGNGYIIHRSTEIGRKEFSALDEMKEFQLISGKKQEHLFSLEDVPKQQMKTDEIRLGSLVWDQKNDQILFSVQEMTEEAGVTIWMYDRKSRQFTFIDRIESINKQKGIGIEGMTASPDGRYLALDLFVGSAPYTTVLIYDLEKGKRSAQLDQAHSLFWQGNRFLFERFSGQQAMLSSKSF